MATLTIGPADRDAAGNIKLNSSASTEPRSLADLLPTPAAVKQDAARVMPQRMSRGEMGALAIVGLVAVFILFYAWSTPTAAPAQIERAVIMPPTVPPARPTAAPTAEPVRMLGAYAAPDGALLGQIEETRAITPTAHYGGGWVQADVSGSGRVWLRAGDMPSLALVGPDLAPRAEISQAEAPAAWNPPAPVVEVAPTLPPTVLAAVFESGNGQKATAGGDWCRGAHLDDSECQESRDAGHGQKVQQ